MKISLLSAGLAVLLAAGLLQAQESRSKGEVSDPMRKCDNRDKQPDIPASGLIFYSTSWGNNPQEGQYRREMERLLRIEIQNVRDAINDIEKKHKEYTELFPDYKWYHEIVLEDDPGSWRNGIFQNSRKVIAFHFTETGMDCVVLDLYAKSIYDENNWTRKVLRLYYPHIQSIEMQTVRHNYQLGGTLDRAEPRIQIEALRKMNSHMREAVYTIDMRIAAYYNYRDKVNGWQTGM